MSKRDFGQAINTLANVGVIAGIVFLAVELSQNNELLEMEARTVLIQNQQDGWDRIAENPELVSLFIKDRNGELLTEAEEFRLNAFWMSYLIRSEWQFTHFSDGGTNLESLRRVNATYGSFRRTWSGNATGARSASRKSFSPEFASYVDRVIESTP